MRVLLDLEIAIADLKPLIQEDNSTRTYEGLMDFTTLALESVVLMGLATSTKGTDHIAAIFRLCNKFFSGQKNKVFY